MANPPVLVCDTDALLQLLLADLTTPLRVLRDRYGIQPVILPEVEAEIRSHTRLARRVAPQFKKACERRLIRIVDSPSSLLDVFQGSFDGTALWTAIQKRGADYKRQVDLGEAYTHAAAVELRAPAMSHDHNAIRALEYKNWPVAEPTLRVYDVLVLCRQIGEIDDQSCNRFRKVMIQEREWISLAFQNSSFEDGLGKFDPRLIDGDENPLNPQLSPDRGSKKQMVISRLRD